MLWPGGRLYRHIVVTPLRNEVEFLPQLIDTITKQTITPLEWIIVDDCSTDSSVKLIEEARSRFEWIKLVRVEEESDRGRGEKIARLVNIGLKSSKIDWSFFSKIDSDILLPENYFEEIFKIANKYNIEPKLFRDNHDQYLVAKQILAGETSEWFDDQIKLLRSLEEDQAKERENIH